LWIIAKLCHCQFYNNNVNKYRALITFDFAHRHSFENYITLIEEHFSKCTRIFAQGRILEIARVELNILQHQKRFYNTSLVTIFFQNLMKKKDLFTLNIEIIKNRKKLIKER